MENKDNLNQIKRLIVDIPNELHIEIKMRATKRGISIKKYIIRAIMETIKKEKEYE